MLQIVNIAINISKWFIFYETAESARKNCGFHRLSKVGFWPYRHLNFTLKKKKEKRRDSRSESSEKQLVAEIQYPDNAIALIARFAVYICEVNADANHISYPITDSKSLGN